MPRKGVKIGLTLTYVDTNAGYRLTPVEQQFGPNGMGEVGGTVAIEHAAKDVGDMREGHHAVIGRQHRFRRIQIDAAVGRQWANVDLPPGKLPGHDIRMVFEP